MAEKIMNTRSQQKNDTESKWDLVPDFIPKKGEIVVYNTDENNKSPRVKIGDGMTVVGSLPFIHGYDQIGVSDDGAGNVQLILK